MIIKSVLTESQLNNLITKAEELKTNRYLRDGQSYMIALHHIRPDVYNIMTLESLSDNNKFSDIDCFYNDNNIDNFFNYLMSENTNK